MLRPVSPHHDARGSDENVTGQHATANGRENVSGLPSLLGEGPGERAYGYETNTVFVSLNSSTAFQPSSRWPLPLCFVPPKGICGSAPVVPALI